MTHEPKASIFGLFADVALKYPDKPAFITRSRAGGREEITYRSFFSAVTRAAEMLGERGATTGSRVVLMGENSPGWCAAYLGIHGAGLTAVPLDAGYGREETENLLRFVRPAAAFCDASSRHYFEGLPSVISWEDLDFAPRQAAFRPVPLEKESPMSIIFTSGTTALPKGVMLGEENFLHNLRVLEQQPGIHADDDRVLAILPFHHVYPFTCVFLAQICRGSTIVFPASIAGADIADAMAAEGSTVLPAVPQIFAQFHRKIFDGVKAKPPPVRALFHALLKLSATLRFCGINAGPVFFRSIHKKFPRLRYFSSGGARLEPDILKDFHALGFTILEAYGLTETAPIVAMNTLDRQIPGSVGTAVAGVEIKTKRLSPEAAHGEVCVRGPNVMRGYLDNPEETAKVLKDGWFHTGDLGYIDRDGALFLTGRAKEVIVLPSGKNIYPEELEKRYSKSAKIEEVCILSLPGERKDVRQLTAVAVPDNNYFRKHKTAGVYQEVKYDIETISVQLPGHQRVTRVEIFDEALPRTRLGKLKRYRIANRLLEKDAALAGGEEKKAERIDAEDPLLDFFRRHLGLKKPPHRESNLETDLGLDSLGKIELYTAFEKQFGTRIPDDEMESVVTIAHLRPYLAQEADAAAFSDKGSDITLQDHVDTGAGIAGGIVRFLGHFFLLLTCKILFRAVLKGKRNLPSGGPYLVVPNHASYIDGALVYAMLPYRISRRMFSLSIPIIFERFPYALLRRKGRVIMTGTPETTIPSLRYGKEALQRGFPLCIFPEGERTASGKIENPRSGVGILAHDTGAPLIPVYIRGAQRLLSRKHPGFRLSRIQLEVLPPISADQTPENILKEWKTVMKRREEDLV